MQARRSSGSPVTLTCNLCGVKLNAANRRAEHIRRDHLKVPFSSCSACGKKSFDRIGTVQEHAKQCKEGALAIDHRPEHKDEYDKYFRQCYH